MARVLWFGLFALAALAVEAAPVRADLAAPWPWRWFESRQPRPPRYISTPETDSTTPQPTPQVGAVDSEGRPYPPPAPRDPPKRTGPFRSCGSGMGLGLAGIGVAGMLLWLGNRFAGRISRRVKQ